MVNLYDIHLEGPNPFALSGTFAFRIQEDDSVTLFLCKRKSFFLEGVVHELTEASVIQALENLGYLYSSLWDFEVQINDFFCCHMWHLVTVMSMPLYSHNKKHRIEFESLFKGAPKNDL